MIPYMAALLWVLLLNSMYFKILPGKPSKEVLQFAEITKKVIARDGFEEFLPTACFPERKHVEVLTGLPPNADVESAAIKWASRSASANEEFLIAFRTDGNHFKVIRQKGKGQEEFLFKVSGL